MKNTFIFLIAILCFKTNAQLNRGRSMLGGSFNVYSQTQKSDVGNGPNGYGVSTSKKYHTLNGSIRYGYFIQDNVMFGIYGSYSEYRDETKTDNGPSFNSSSSINHSTSTVFSGGLFARYYKILGKSKFAVFGQFSAGYGAGQSKTNSTYKSPASSSSSSSTGHGNTSQVQVFINPGITYFISDRFAMEASFGNVGYNWQHAKNYDDTNHTSTEDFSSGFSSYLTFSLQSLSLGFNFYFGDPRHKSQDSRSKTQD